MVVVVVVVVVVRMLSWMVHGHLFLHPRRLGWRYDFLTASFWAQVSCCSILHLHAELDLERCLTRPCFDTWQRIGPAHVTPRHVVDDTPVGAGRPRKWEVLDVNAPYPIGKMPLSIRVFDGSKQFPSFSAPDPAVSEQKYVHSVGLWVHT